MTPRELFQKVRQVQYTHLEEEAASFFYEREGDTLRIFFEESNGATDWRNNFDFPAEPYRDMEDKWFAHRGFLRVWKNVEPHLVEAIADPTVSYIEICGYSHGAAVALLCYEYCKFHRPDIVVDGYGFGAPRVVWGWVPKNVKARLKGFVVVRNGKDLVTHLPPVFFGFRHVGKVKKIGKSEGLIKDHMASRYREALKAEEE